MINVSVIIPIYNKAPWLDHCLKSVLQQNIDSKEIICINDGSTDGSEKIIRKLADENKEIFLVNQENHGVGYARNKGIDLARGEFIAFMDADDYYPDNSVLKLLYTTAKNNNVTICGGSYYKTYGGKVIPDEKMIFNDNKKMVFTEYQFTVGFTRFIYKASLLKDNNIYFPLYKTHEDPIFMLKAMICGKEFYSIKNVVYIYRKKGRARIFRKENIADYIRGIADELKICRKESLGKLYSERIRHLNRSVLPLICNEVADGNSEIIGLLSDLQKAAQDGRKNEEALLSENYLRRLALKCYNYESLYLQKLQNSNQIIVYGAGFVAMKVIKYLLEKSIENILCVAVTDIKDNQDELLGVRVRAVNELIEYKDSALVIIATFESLHDEIKEQLMNIGFTNISPVTIIEQILINRLR